MEESGIYRHFKGNYYRLLFVGKESETEEAVAVYQALYGECGVWVRPLSMWNETVEVDGKKVRRFERVDFADLDLCIDKVALIYIEDGRVLMTRSKNNAKYYFPGGKREHGESDAQTLTREIKEELDTDIVPESAQYYGSFYAHKNGGTAEKLIMMTCYRADFDGTPAASNEIAEIKWLTYRDRDRTNSAGLLIFDELYEKGLIKY